MEPTPPSFSSFFFWKCIFICYNFLIDDTFIIATMLDTAPSTPPVLNTMNHGAYHTVVGQRVCCTSPAGGIFLSYFIIPHQKKSSSFSSLSLRPLYLLAATPTPCRSPPSPSSLPLNLPLYLSDIISLLLISYIMPALLFILFLVPPLPKKKVRMGSVE